MTEWKRPPRENDSRYWIVYFADTRRANLREYYFDAGKPVSNYTARRWGSKQRSEHTDYCGTPHSADPIIWEEYRDYMAERSARKQAIADKNPKVVAIDFDNTLYTGGDVYPRTGPPDLDLIRAVNYAYDKGHIIIINSCRTGTVPIGTAKQFLKRNKVKYHCFNENHHSIISKYPADSRKISADVYIDDKALGYNRDQAICYLLGLPDIALTRVRENQKFRQRAGNRK